MEKPKNVDEYISLSPHEVQPRLKELRRIIKKIVPEADERISYGMPFYDYHGRLVYFASAKGYIGLYIPPPIIEENKKELKGLVTTKSAVHLSNALPLPVDLIKKLIKARMVWNLS